MKHSRYLHHSPDLHFQAENKRGLRLGFYIFFIKWCIIIIVARKWSAEWALASPLLD